MRRPFDEEDTEETDQAAVDSLLGGAPPETSPADMDAGAMGPGDMEEMEEGEDMGPPPAEEGPDAPPAEEPPEDPVVLVSDLKSTLDRLERALA